MLSRHTMCSRKLKFVCLPLLNDSVMSEAYTGTKDEKYTEINIIFKNKNRKLVGIDEKTTFNDLITAILITRNQSLNKHEKLKQKARNLNESDYLICQSINNVEKVLDSNTLVRNELKRASRELILLNDQFAVVYTMRSKQSIQCLSFDSNSYRKRKSSVKRVPVLEEFCHSTQGQLTGKNKKNTTSSSKVKEDLQSKLKLMDRFVDERMKYLNLLEDYLALLESIEHTPKLKRSDPKVDLDVDVDSGFNSASSACSSHSSLNMSEKMRNGTDSSSKFETLV